MLLALIRSGWHQGVMVQGHIPLYGRWAASSGGYVSGSQEFAYCVELVGGMP